MTGQVLCPIKRGDIAELRCYELQAEFQQKDTVPYNLCPCPNQVKGERLKELLMAVGLMTQSKRRHYSTCWVCLKPKERSQKRICEECRKQKDRERKRRDMLNARARRSAKRGK